MSQEHTFRKEADDTYTVLNGKGEVVMLTMNVQGAKNLCSALNGISSPSREHTVEEIRGALARAYCTEKNGLKEFDSDLIEAMALEIEKLFESLHHSHTEEIEHAIEKGRLSVLKDFDDMCKADAFVGFTLEEWNAVQKFFEFNKQISGWDTPNTQQ